MINVIGEIMGTSGYANHTKQLANALYRVTPTRISTNLQSGWESQLSDSELEMIKKKAEGEEINLIVTNPLFWRMNAFAKRNWAYLIWEGDTVPKWIVEEALNPNIELIFCPSKHTAKAIQGKDRIIDEKIRIVPHGVDISIFKIKVDEDSPIKQLNGKFKPFRFMANKGLRNMEDRGGIQYLIKAYLQEFKPEEDAELFLKINPVYGIPNLLKMFPELKKKTPKVIVHNDQVTLQELAKMYNECDVFVSPTRAEAFNLPCLEAMGCGKPVITTNFGGQTDYVNDKVGWIIGGRKEEVKHELQYEGIKWLTPSIPQLRKAMRGAFNDIQTCREKGVNAQIKAVQMDWSNTANIIKQFI